MATSPSERVRITPSPTDEEAVAIVAASEALWPRPVAAEPVPVVAAPKWRFSGRWWSRPVAARRVRPW